MQRRDVLLGSAAGAASAFLPRLQTRAEAASLDTLRELAEAGPNSRDPHGAGVASPSLGTFTNIYDRLINFGHTEIAPGIFKYDYTKFTGELAESFEVLDDGKRLRFHLRQSATFHDGSPVTAADVKWSFDRGVSLPGSKYQLATGSLTDPAQFVVVDPATFEIHLPRGDRYTLPNLALTFASILNSKLIQSHATASDPWGADWLRDNEAGGGAYRITNWQAGQRVTYTRFDDWKSGPAPALRQISFEVVPTAESRVAALEKGDADIALQLPPQDIAHIAADPHVHVVSIPVTNTFRFIAFDTQTAPFTDARVRQAIAYALPFEDILQAAVYGHGTPLFGAKSAQPKNAAFPQPYPYNTEIARARSLLAAAGHGRGFSTTLSYNVADNDTAEPIAILVQQALAPLNINVQIEKISAADWATRLTAKTVPFFIESSSAWFNDPDYFFRIFFQGNWRWNFGSFNNPDLAKLLTAARWETDPAKYDALMEKAVGIVFQQLPILPLWQPTFEAGFKPGLTNFIYYIHGQVDYRPLRWA
ncbi:ABC transporter substrate-binding protein [Acidisoma silvae]|uniref:ABC transporter substrate-binding protein n=1 Tax=Acidisoma silvae TaxID=2802396 RepID=A0A963YW68_9PROT|nr:ABC transporter substrate-binding protein [Acidisoma silvae]MCB8877990.1 ABC transporter substrate-binding protein [Acidisoma silvae]